MLLFEGDIMFSLKELLSELDEISKERVKNITWDINKSIENPVLKQFIQNEVGVLSSEKDSYNWVQNRLEDSWRFEGKRTAAHLVKIHREDIEKQRNMDLLCGQGIRNFALYETIKDRIKEKGVLSHGIEHLFAVEFYSTSVLKAWFSELTWEMYDKICGRYRDGYRGRRLLLELLSTISICHDFGRRIFHNNASHSRNRLDILKDILYSAQLSESEVNTIINVVAHHNSNKNQRKSMSSLEKFLTYFVSIGDTCDRGERSILILAEKYPSAKITKEDLEATRIKWQKATEVLSKFENIPHTECIRGVFEKRMHGCICLLDKIDKSSLYHDLIPLISSKYLLREIVSTRYILGQIHMAANHLDENTQTYTLENITKIDNIPKFDLFAIPNSSDNIWRSKKRKELWLSIATKRQKRLDDFGNSFVWKDQISKFEELSEISLFDNPISDIYKNFGKNLWTGLRVFDDSFINRLILQSISKFGIETSEIEGFGKGHWVLKPHKPYYYGIPTYRVRHISLEKYDDWFENWPDVAYPIRSYHVC